VDALAARFSIRLKKPFGKRYALGKGVLSGGRSLVLVKPLTYMNRSGEIIHSLLRYANTSIEDLLVVCDTLDLPPGECRLRRKGSSAGHNGLDSVLRCAGTSNIARLYIGIGHPGPRREVINYVLGVPSKKDRGLIDEALVRAEEGVIDLLDKPMEAVMMHLNEKRRD